MFQFILAVAVVVAWFQARKLRREHEETRRMVDRLNAELGRLWIKVDRAPGGQQETGAPSPASAEPPPAAQPAPPAQESAAPPKPEPASLTIEQILQARIAAQKARIAASTTQEEGDREKEKEKEKEKKGQEEEGVGVAASVAQGPVPSMPPLSFPPPGSLPADQPPALPPAPPPIPPGESFGEKPPESPIEKMDLETKIGTIWVRNIALVLIAIAAAYFAKAKYNDITPPLKVVLAYGFAMALVALGKFLEPKLEKFARPVMAGGMAMGFFVAFAAHFVPPMACIPFTASIAWMAASVGVLLFVTDRWKSESTAAMAIFLGHVCAFVAAGEADAFSLIAIAFLSGTAVFMFVRHDWPALSMFSLVAAYASHVIWAVAAKHDPSTPAQQFWSNFSFLSSYYVIFMAADLFWWAKTARKGDAAFSMRQHLSARAMGPANLVFYVSLISLLYAGTKIYVPNIEWFFFGLAAGQLALAWAHRRVGNRDWVFYPALAVIFVTIGFFAAFQALTLNLVLAVEAIILLIAAHRTRLWVFHGLAQAALALNFFHYWILTGGRVSVPDRTVASLIGGMAVTSVYFIKSQLEELWYGGETRMEWQGLGRDGPISKPLAQFFDELFTPIAPYFAHAHAVAGSMILANLCREYFAAADAALAVSILIPALAALALLRRSIPLSLGWTALQAGLLFLCARAGGLPEIEVGPWFALWLAASGWATCAGAAALAPPRFSDPKKLAQGGGSFAVFAGSAGVPTGMAREDTRAPGDSLQDFRLPVLGRALACGQGALWIALVTGIGCLGKFGERTLPFYFAGLGVIALVYLCHDRVAAALRRIKAETGAQSHSVALSSAAVCVAAAFLLWGHTARVFGAVYNVDAAESLALVILGAALMIAAGLRRLWAFYISGFLLMLFCHHNFYFGLDRTGNFVAGGVDHPLLTCAIVAITLAIAASKDFLMRGHWEKIEAASRPAFEALVYAPYALGLFLLCDFTRHLAGMPWAMAVIPLYALALHLIAGELGMRRGMMAGLLTAFVPHFLYLSFLADRRAPALADPLLPALLLMAQAIALERLIVIRKRLETEFAIPALSPAARWALVAGTAFVALLAGYHSPTLGEAHQWTTAGWAALGAALMTLGFVFGSRIYRRTALAVFALCLARVFLVDTRGLDNDSRMLAFFTLGLCLLGVAWLYARFSEKIKKWL